MKLLFNCTFSMLVVGMGLVVYQSETSAAFQESTVPPANAQTTEAQETALQPPGIAVDETLPEIKLKNQVGEMVSVQEMLRDGPVAIVFYRSASW